jgi:hypothetical protein
MMISTRYDLWQLVYVAHDPEQVARMVTGIEVAGTGVLYSLSLAGGITRHYEQELCPEPNIVTKTQ